MDKLTAITFEIKDRVAIITLSRPSKLNTFNQAMFDDLQTVFEYIDICAMNTESNSPDIRCVVIKGAGKHFCAGIDFSFASNLFVKSKAAQKENDPSRFAHEIKILIDKLQYQINAPYRCRIPVIAAIHGAAYGLSIDLLSWCDMRIASKDSKYCVKEIDLGFPSDIGALSLFPRLTNNESFARRAIMTAEVFDAEKAFEIGFLSTLMDNQDSLNEYALKLAASIASKSPVAVQTLKESLQFSRDRSISDGLKNIVDLNMSMLLTKDLQKAAIASMTRKTAQFPRL